MLPLVSFDTKPWIEVVNQLICADEVKRALDLLDNLPAYYRILGNEPKEITDLRNDIMKWIACPSFYSNHVGCEVEMESKGMINSLRGALLVEDVRNCNKNGFIPLVVDLGPGEYWAPITLEAQGCDFRYYPIYVNKPSYDHFLPKFQKYLVKDPEYTGPKIFFAGEILEHLWQPMDIRFEMQKVGTCEIAHVTTPNATFNPNVKDWRTVGFLGHLHAITYEEFKLITQKIFKEYQGCFYESQVLHARFILPEGKYDFLKTHYEVRIQE
jgi:hypothetical protein